MYEALVGQGACIFGAVRHSPRSRGLWSPHITHAAVFLLAWSGLNLSREVGRYNGALPASVRNARFQQVIISSTRKLELTDIDGCWLTDGMVFFSGLASTTIGRTGRVRFTCIIHGRGLTALASS